MKHWRVIAISFLALAPLVLFAAISQYENPLCGTVSSLPEFIKAVLTIIVKVGIPVATLFIIWSGFLFLTAQGNETQLTKAKKAFVWSCIGTAVLLGAWLLATAINATVQSLGGGTNGGGATGTTVSGGCNTAPALPPTTNLALSPIVPLIIGAEKQVQSGLTTIFGVGGGCPGPSQITPFLQNFDIMAAHGLSQTDPQLFNKVLVIAHNDAVIEGNEQAYVLLSYASGGGLLIKTAIGNENNVTSIQAADFNALLNSPTPGVNKISSIRLIHTHPYFALRGQAPPSLTDLFTTNELSNTLPQTTYLFSVADANGVWNYATPMSGQFAQTMASMKQNMHSILALPEVSSKVTITQCSSPAEVNQVVLDSLNGKYGAQAQALAVKINNSARMFEPFLAQDARFRAATSEAEKAAIMQERLALERSLGVSLQYTPM